MTSQETRRALHWSLRAQKLKPCVNSTGLGNCNSEPWCPSLASERSEICFRVSVKVERDGLGGWTCKRETDPAPPWPRSHSSFRLHLATSLHYVYCCPLVSVCNYLFFSLFSPSFLLSLWIGNSSNEFMAHLLHEAFSDYFKLQGSLLTLFLLYYSQYHTTSHLITLFHVYLLRLSILNSL